MLCIFGVLHMLHVVNYLRVHACFVCKLVCDILQSACRFLHLRHLALLLNADVFTHVGLPLFFYVVWVHFVFLIFHVFNVFFIF